MPAEDYIPKSKRGPLAIAAKRCKGLTGQEYKDCIVSVTKELKLSISEDKVPRERVRGSVEEAEEIIQSLSVTIEGLEKVIPQLAKITRPEFKLSDEQERQVADVHLAVSTQKTKLEDLKRDWENLKLELLRYP